MKLILASASPRRKILFQNLFDKFEIYAPKIEERAMPGELPDNFTLRISKAKAESIPQSARASSNTLLISCDTIVAINNQIIGKPSDIQDAINTIQILNGKIHDVISSITLLYINNGSAASITESEVSRVTFKDLTDNEIIEYLKKFDYTDKAGAYAIQEHGSSIIESIEGSITNIIGFPLRLFFRMLCEMGILDKMPFKTII